MFVYKENRNENEEPKKVKIQEFSNDGVVDPIESRRVLRLGTCKAFS